ncbi:prostaglandin reductase 1-like isoform X2 [Physella acuta]|uniref:prostaglandin reductase 1-like isoform X2 n=1 Tax=Physella acuta TaxID=109671 RepID=UPI0027DE944E|nr:prostaglandin reductase 1-like isoform X2 [Physella acuta]
MVTCMTWIKSKPFVGVPKRSDFRKMKEDLSTNLKPKEILIEALYWTADHYLKIFDVPIGTAMIGDQIASVINSRHDDYPLQTLVVTQSGWRTHSILNPDEIPIRKIIKPGGLPVSLFLGSLGLPGLCAYFGLFEICQIKAGETLLINAASSAVSNVAGQIAKIKNCKVIAFCGSKDRCDWVRELGFDYVFNYNTVRVGPALKRVTSQGIDCYFDCVGSQFTEGVLENMKNNGTMCMCGYVDSYGRQTTFARKQDPYRMISIKERQVFSASVYDFTSRFNEAERHLLEWIKQGKIKYREVIMEGFDKLPDALAALYDGRNVGKIIVKSTNFALMKSDDGF